MNCLECEEYNHKEMYCPKFCDVIRTAVKDIQKDSIPILWIKEYIDLQESYDTDWGDMAGVTIRELLRYCAERKEE